LTSRRSWLKALGLGVVVGTLASLLMRRGRRAASAASAAERPDDDGLERLTRPELYRRAQAAGIAGRSEMTKAQLIAALRAAGEPRRG
jgi:hypothetical protein